MIRPIVGVLDFIQLLKLIFMNDLLSFQEQELRYFVLR